MSNNESKKKIVALKEEIKYERRNKMRKVFTQVNDEKKEVIAYILQRRRFKGLLEELEL